MELKNHVTIMILGDAFMDKIIFTYRLTHDTGFAPCVDNGLLTLACCKGGTETVKRGLRYFIGRFFEENLQKNVEVYISGIYSGKLLYIAKIDKVITMNEYFVKKEYKGRTDQIYRLDGAVLKRDKRKLKGIHDDEHSNNCDRNGKYVLISKEFVFLGNKAIDIDESILSFYPKGRGQYPKGQYSRTPVSVLTTENKNKSKELYIKLQELINEKGYTLTSGKVSEPHNPLKIGSGHNVCGKE